MDVSKLVKRAVDNARVSRLNDIGQGLDTRPAQYHIRAKCKQDCTLGSVGSVAATSLTQAQAKAYFDLTCTHGVPVKFGIKCRKCIALAGRVRAKLTHKRQT